MSGESLAWIFCYIPRSGTSWAAGKVDNCWPHSRPLSLCTRLIIQSDSCAKKKKKRQVWTTFPLRRNTAKTSEKAGSNPAISATEERRLEEAGRRKALLLRWGKGQLDVVRGDLS